MEYDKQKIIDYLHTLTAMQLCTFFNVFAHNLKFTNGWDVLECAHSELGTIFKPDTEFWGEKETTHEIYTRSEMYELIHSLLDIYEAMYIDEECTDIWEDFIDHYKGFRLYAAP